MAHDSHYDYFQYLTKRSKFSREFRSPFIHDLARHFHGRVLDVGCGMGEFLEAYQNSFGLEINPHLAIHCAQRGLEVSLSSIFSLPFRDCSFDGILISNVLEHLDDPGSGFGEAARVLKPGGVLTVTVPFQAGFRRDKTHVHFLQKNDLVDFGMRFGLKGKQVYSFPHFGSILGNLITFYELRAVFTKP